jgi:ubiquinone/menaquinone biosynthesis C-methylase UbiE
MDDKEAGRFWNDNAEAWTELARAGFDVYRDRLNTPAFFDILPDIKGLSGIDIGCGEGHNTRLLSKRGARIKAIDISEVFIDRAREIQPDDHSIEYSVASATELPFENDQFDFATSFMCLMDFPETEKALEEAYRVLKPGGFLQFSITHPCFNTPRRKNLRNFFGKTYDIEVGEYFNDHDGRIEEWIFGSTPLHLKKRFKKFKIPLFNKTLSQWMNAIIKTGFTIEQVNEPFPDNETVKKYPYLQDAQVVAYFLHIRCRKVNPVK